MKRARLQAVNPVLELGLSNKDREAYYEALAAKCGPVSIPYTIGRHEPIGVYLNRGRPGVSSGF